MCTTGPIEEGDIIFVQDAEVPLYECSEAERAAISAAQMAGGAWSSSTLASSAFARVTGTAGNGSGGSQSSKSGSSRLGHLDLATASPLSARRAAPAKKCAERGLRIRTRKERLAEERKQKSRAAADTGDLCSSEGLDILTGDLSVAGELEAPPGSPVDTFAGDAAGFEQQGGVALFDGIL